MAEMTPNVILLAEMTATDLSAILVAVGSLLATIWTLVLLPTLRKRASAEQDETKRRAYLQALDVIDAIMRPAVAATQQTLVQDLHKIDPLRKLSDEQGSTAMKFAIDKGLTHLGEAGVQELQGKLGIDRDAFMEVLRVRAEAAVLELKRTDAATNVAIVDDAR